MNKQYVKNNAAKLVALLADYDAIKRADGLWLDGINRDFAQGVTLTEYDNRAKFASIWTKDFAKLDNDTYGYVDIPEDEQRYTTCTMNGAEWLPTENAKAEKLLKAVANDEALFTAIKTADMRYDGRIQWTVDTCIIPMDFDEMRDGHYTESIITLNPTTGRISETKPQHYSRSVLVALNID
ncbi:MAG: hypothetical protein LBN02_01795 [Oscillospiraceae bacterium]|jgi:hypothetical protein|nr:hypothetical protein [Oscillospiraceae bacterium]